MGHLICPLHAHQPPFLVRSSEGDDLQSPTWRGWLRPVSVRLSFTLEASIVFARHSLSLPVFHFITDHACLNLARTQIRCHLDVPCSQCPLDLSSFAQPVLPLTGSPKIGSEGTPRFVP